MYAYLELVDDEELSLSGHGINLKSQAKQYADDLIKIFNRAVKDQFPSLKIRVRIAGSMPAQWISHQKNKAVFNQLSDVDYYICGEREVDAEVIANNICFIGSLLEAQLIKENKKIKVEKNPSIKIPYFNIKDLDNNKDINVGPRELTVFNYQIDVDAESYLIHYATDKFTDHAADFVSYFDDNRLIIYNLSGHLAEAVKGNMTVLGYISKALSYQLYIGKYIRVEDARALKSFMENVGNRRILELLCERLLTQYPGIFHSNDAVKHHHAAVHVHCASVIDHYNQASRSLSKIAHERNSLLSSNNFLSMVISNQTHHLKRMEEELKTQLNVQESMEKKLTEENERVEKLEAEKKLLEGQSAIMGMVVSSHLAEREKAEKNLVTVSADLDASVSQISQEKISKSAADRKITELVRTQGNDKKSIHDLKEKNILLESEKESDKKAYMTLREEMKRDQDKWEEEQKRLQAENEKLKEALKQAKIVKEAPQPRVSQEAAQALPSSSSTQAPCLTKHSKKQTLEQAWYAGVTAFIAARKAGGLGSAEIKHMFKAMRAASPTLAGIEVIAEHFKYMRAGKIEDPYPHYAKYDLTWSLSSLLQPQTHARLLSGDPLTNDVLEKVLSDADEGFSKENIFDFTKEELAHHDTRKETLKLLCAWYKALIKPNGNTFNLLCLFETKLRPTENKAFNKNNNNLQ